MSVVVAIDDSQEQLDALAAVLGDTGIELLTYVDARAGIHRCLVEPPDLLVTDLGMPGFDGLEVLEALRIHYPRERLPVLILSARGEEESLMAAFEAGADDYVVKPVQAGELRAKVRRLLHNARARSVEHVVDRIPTGPIDADRPPVYNGYRVLEVIGRGGMGVVYLAESLDTGERVAIKRVSEGIADDPASTYRFLREAQVLKAVDHPNIVRFVDLSLGAREACLVMEYVEGPSLQRLVTSEGPLPLPRALHVVLQVARAVDYLAGRGVVHGDLKPANLLVTGGDVVKVTDFGVARRPFDPEVTSPGLVVGTLPMLPPERIQGRGPDVAGEVYALGVLLFYTLTGTYPYLKDEPAALLGSILAGIPDVRRLEERGVPLPVVDAIVALLASDPRRRPAPTEKVVGGLETLWQRHR